MWATAPKLVSQPAVEMHTPDAGRPGLFGYQESKSPRSWSCTLTNGQRLVGPPRGCLHLRARKLSAGSSMYVRLADSHELRVRCLATDGVNGYTTVLGAAAWPFSYYELSLGGATSVIAMPITDEDLIAACGYALTPEGWVFYGFAAQQSMFWSYAADHLATALVSSPHFGYGTASLRSPVSEYDINMRTKTELGYEGSQSLVVTAMASHDEPFVRAGQLKPNTPQERTQAPYTMVNSLRSRACSFLLPGMSFQFLAENLADNAGHPEVLRFGLWPASLANQPNSDTAYVCRDVPWKSNLFESDAANELLARVRVRWNNDNPSQINISGNLFSVPAGFVDCDTNALANNSYRGQSGFPFSVATWTDVLQFTHCRAFVGISLSETVSGSPDLLAASVGVTGHIVVGVFYVRDNGQVFRQSVVRTLDQADFDALSSGSAITVSGSNMSGVAGFGVLNVTVQAIGPTPG